MAHAKQGQKSRRKNVYRNRGYDPTRRRRFFMKAAYVVVVLMAASLALSSYIHRVNQRLPKDQTKTKQASLPLPPSQLPR